MPIAKRSPVIKRINITPIDSFAGRIVANNAAFTNPIPPIAVLENPVRNPISASNEIKAKDIWQR
jgi:hypothetical protein